MSMVFAEVSTRIATDMSAYFASVSSRLIPALMSTVSSLVRRQTPRTLAQTAYHLELRSRWQLSLSQHRST